MNERTFPALGKVRKVAKIKKGTGVVKTFIYILRRTKVVRVAFKTEGLLTSIPFKRGI